MTNQNPDQARRSFAIFGVLLSALIILAILQYKWVGQVADGERQHMEEVIQKSVDAIAGEGSRTLWVALATFQPRLPVDRGDQMASLIQQFRQWQVAAPYPRLIKELFLIRRESQTNTELQQFRTDGDEFLTVPWPAEFQGLHHILTSDVRSFVLETVVPSNRTLALIPVTPLLRPPFPGAFPMTPGSRQSSWVLLVFDREYLQTEFVPSLVAKHFEQTAGTDYRVSVVQRSDPPQTVYQVGPEDTLDWSQPDGRTMIFEAPFGARGMRAVLNGVLPNDAASALPRLSGLSRSSESIPRALFALGPQLAGLRWELLVKHEAGSVNAAVESIRRRNLTVSIGILAVLGAGFAATVASSARARALARMQMDFVAGVSHELRTPVAVIRSGCFNIFTGAVTKASEIKDYARMMEQNADRLSRMIDQILLYARAQSGRASYDIRATRILEVVENALATMAPAIQQADAHVTCTVPPDLPPVAADSTALTHCVQNILSNALKYGKSADLLIIGIHAALNEHSEMVELTFTDQGMGIAPPELPRIFDAFYRGNHSGVPGNGLGLSLVTQMMEQQSGKVSVTSEVGRGTSFTLHMPVAR